MENKSLEFAKIWIPLLIYDADSVIEAIKKIQAEYPEYDIYIRIKYGMLGATAIRRRGKGR